MSQSTPAPFAYPADALRPTVDYLLASQQENGEIPWFDGGHTDPWVVHIDSGTLPTIIGEYVTVGHGAIVHACTLQDNSFVGMGAIVLDGAVVESGAMVAAGALVPPGKTVPSGQLWAGSPAKLMRELDEATQHKFLQTAHKYVEFGRAARLGLAGGPYKFTPVPLPPKTN